MDAKEFTTTLRIVLDSSGALSTLDSNVSTDDDMDNFAVTNGVDTFEITVAPAEY